MTFPKLSQVTTTMIYIGTLLLSILSFVTTFLGLRILLDIPLAAIGSFGLQIAMLGLAWSLMNVRRGRGRYVVVFMITASLSMFFSYANFDAALKGHTRSSDMRAQYIDAARPALTAYALAVKDASLSGRYQVNRLNDLVELERTKGWATVVDEGSQDPFVQSVLEGARRTVDSWRRTQGSDYRQGGGQGIIVNYLQSRLAQAQGNLSRVEQYRGLLDSVQYAFGRNISVDEQYAMVNRAYISFPSSEVTLLTSKAADVPPPPNPTNFVETPVNGQQEFLMVMADLKSMDYLTIFSLLLAFAVDFIVIVMAFVGSQQNEMTDLVLERIKEYTSRHIRKLPVDNIPRMTDTLRQHMERMQVASRYDLDIAKFLDRHQQQRGRMSITLHRGEERADGIASQKQSTRRSRKSRITVHGQSTVRTSRSRNASEPAAR